MASTRSERAPLLGGDSASILAAVAAEEGRVDPPRGGGRPDDDESSGRRRRRFGGVAATIATTACLALLGRGGFPGTLPGSPRPQDPGEGWGKGFPFDDDTTRHDTTRMERDEAKGTSLTRRRVGG